jgi:hypothetical protein
MFWKDDTELIKEYCEQRRNGNTPSLALLVVNIIKQFTNIVPYLLTTLDSMIGMHQVYIVTFTNKGMETLFKIGYTKHFKISKRFYEKRWGEKLIIKDIIRQDELPALGAVEFETFIKESLPPTISLDKSNPGKSEFYNLEQLDDILEIWLSNIHKYENRYGVKSPN